MNKIKFEIGVYPFLSNPKEELPQFIILQNKEYDFTILVDIIYDKIFINNDAINVWKEVTGSNILVKKNIISFKKSKMVDKEYCEEKFYYCDNMYLDIFGENMYDWIEYAMHLMYTRLHNFDPNTKSFTASKGLPIYSDHMEIQENPIEYSYKSKPFIYNLMIQSDYKYIEEVDKKLFLLYDIVEDKMYIGKAAIEKMFELSNWKLSEEELTNILNNGFDNGDATRFDKFNINLFRLNKKEWLNQYHRYWTRSY